jgi:hypothetical protein
MNKKWQGIVVALVLSVVTFLTFFLARTGPLATVENFQSTIQAGNIEAASRFLAPPYNSGDSTLLRQSESLRHFRATESRTVDNEDGSALVTVTYSHVDVPDARIEIWWSLRQEEGQWLITSMRGQIMRVPRPVIYSPFDSQFQRDGRQR